MKTVPVHEISLNKLKSGFWYSCFWVCFLFFFMFAVLGFERHKINAASHHSSERLKTLTTPVWLNTTKGKGWNGFTRFWQSILNVWSLDMFDVLFESKWSTAGPRSCWQEISTMMLQCQESLLFPGWKLNFPLFFLYCWATLYNWCYICGFHFWCVLRAPE